MMPSRCLWQCWQNFTRLSPKWLMETPQMCANIKHSRTFFSWSSWSKSEPMVSGITSTSSGLKPSSSLDKTLSSLQENRSKTKGSSTIPSLTLAHEEWGSGHGHMKHNAGPPALLNKKHLDVPWWRGPEPPKTNDIPSAMGSPLCLPPELVLISLLQVIPQWIGHCSGLMLLMVDPLSHSFGQVHVIPNHSPLKDDQHIPQWMPPSVQNRPITQRDHQSGPQTLPHKVTTTTRDDRSTLGSHLALSFKAFLRIYNCICFINSIFLDVSWSQHVQNESKDADYHYFWPWFKNCVWHKRLNAASNRNRNSKYLNDLMCPKNQEMHL